MKTQPFEIKISNLDLFDQNDLLREMTKQNQDNLQFVDWAFENNITVYGCMDFNKTYQGPDYWLNLCCRVAEDVERIECDNRRAFGQFVSSDNVVRLRNGKYAEHLTQYSIEMTFDELYEFFVKEYC